MNAKFGVAGFPLGFTNSELKKDRTNIFAWIRNLGLDALELQMTYGPRMLPETCKEYRKVAADNNIRITVHASYFIVFTSTDPQKILQSSDTLKRTYELADMLDADVVVLHPGPYYAEKSDAAVRVFIENAGRTLSELGTTNIGLFVETAGKLGQVGSVPEILSMSKQLRGVHPCVDFGHVHARTLGTLEDRKNVRQLVDDLSTFLRSNEEKRIHFHYTPINYGPRGEIQHRAIHDEQPQLEQAVLFDDAPAIGRSRDGLFHPRPEVVSQELKRLKSDFIVISETHNSQEVGAMALRDYWHSN